MKRGSYTYILIFALLTSLAEVRADRDDALWGALVGGALGVLVGENSSDIRTEYAVPAFAAIGALAGYYHDRWSDGVAYDDYPYSTYRHHEPYRDGYYGSRYYDHDCDYSFPRLHSRYRGPVLDLRASARSPRSVAVQTAPDPRVQQPEPTQDLHPGVKIVLVPITWPNGIVRQIRLLSLGDRFVGPQGEEYATLPDSTTLAERYSPDAR